MYSKIVLAIDSDDDGEGKRAIAEGVRLLSKDGELHLATIFNPEGAGFFPHVTETTPESLEAQARGRLDLLARKYLPINQPAHLHVMAGPPAEKLIALAADIDAELMILVSRGETERWRLRRPTVKYIATNATCAVLILPAESESTTETSGD